MAADGKLWPGLAPRAWSDADGELAVIVGYRPGADREQRARAVVEGVRVRQVYRVLPFLALEVSEAGLRGLEADPEVECIWPDLPVRALLESAAPAVHAPEVWQVGYTGRGVRIAILDTGIDANHPDLAERVAATTDLTGEGSRDDNGHGTHVAGIVAAGGDRFRGVAPESSLHVAKVLRSDGGGLTSTVIAGLEWAIEQQVQVINLSLGSSGSSDGTDALSTACNTVMARGVVVCVAAGNDGPRSYSVGSPAAAQQVITVGACSLEGQVADFSARGPTADGRVKPDIALPGVAITSCRAAGTSLGAVVDEQYTVASGTSMATPFATGIVALLLEAYPGLRPPEVKERLKRTAKDLGASPYAQGAGLTDALRAYKDEAPPPPDGPPPEPPDTPPPVGCLGTPLAVWRRARSARR